MNVSRIDLRIVACLSGLSFLVSACGADASSLPDAAVGPDAKSSVDSGHTSSDAPVARDVFRSVDARMPPPGRDSSAPTDAATDSMIVTTPDATPTACGAISFTPCALSATDTGLCCGGACVDTSTDINNCGSCSSQCLFAGESCVRGQCTTPPLDCATAPPGSACLDDGGIGTCCGTCRSLDSFFSDPNDCGSCGNICAPGGVCSDMSSSCGQNCMTTPCGPGTACVGTMCLTTTCDASSARKPCALTGASAGTGLCCGSSCADSSTDNLNCGSCGNACAAGSFCDAGVCSPAPTCGVGNSGVACPLASGGVGSCCSGVCASGFASDKNNCGACGAMCPTGDTCVAGVCQGTSVSCPTGTLLSNDSCASPTCAAGENGVVCAFNSEVVGMCCGGACVSLGSDPNHCGACATVCASGACNGECVPLASTMTSPTCSSPGVYYQDPLLGSSCATPSCPAVFPEQYCAVGTAVGVCCSLTDAFDSPQSCADLANDPKNCGSCMVVCPGTQTCEHGVCSGASAACGAGRGDELCDLANGPSWLCCAGGCTNTDTDAKNCGGCSTPCTTGHSCVAGVCQ